MMSELAKYRSLVETCSERITVGQEFIHDALTNDYLIAEYNRAASIDMLPLHQAFQEFDIPTRNIVAYTIADEVDLIIDQASSEGFDEETISQDLVPVGVLNCLAYIMTVGLENYLALSYRQFPELHKN